ncbi:MAG: hypothetical protein M0006_00390 [Magnetospirillum sp.]|nr:hypothetical protein [Magnetospirillum sp.]
MAEYRKTTKRRNVFIAAAIGAAAIAAGAVAILSMELRHEKGDGAILAALSSRSAMSSVVECPEGLNVADDDGICYRIDGDYVGHVSAHPSSGALSIGIYEDDGEEVAVAVKDVQSGKMVDARIAAWHRDALAEIANKARETK